MARRWQLPLWVLIGLVLVVAVLWDNAARPGMTDGSGDRTEAVGGSAQRAITDGVPDDLAFADGDDGQVDTGDGNNLLRPTTTTRPSPTTIADGPGDGGDGETDRDGSVGDDEAGAPDVSGNDPELGSASTVPHDPDAPDPARPTSSPPSDGGGTSPESVTTRPASWSSDVRSDSPEMSTVYYQTFAGGSLAPGDWEVYNSIGHAGWGLRRPSAVAVVPSPGATGDRVLRITARMGRGEETGQLVSGGVKLLGRSMTYGRYRFRARVDADPAEVTSGVVLLWPADNDWPAGGEINIMETWNNRSIRTPVESNLHWAENGRDRVVGVTHWVGGQPISATDWHVYTLEWSRSRVSVSVDGGPPTVLSADPARIPHRPMDLTLQLDAFDSPDLPGVQPTLDGEVRLEIDWIRIERPVEG